MGLIVKKPETGTEDDIYGIDSLIKSYGLELNKETQESIKKANKEKMKNKKGEIWKIY